MKVKIKTQLEHDPVAYVEKWYYLGAVLLDCFHCSGLYRLRGGLIRQVSL